MKPQPSLTFQRHWRWLYFGLGLLALPLLGWVFSGPHRADVTVVAKPWRRLVEIERRVLEMQSDWCDRLPAEAQGVERQMREDPSGQRGLAEYCRFRAPEWRRRRFAVADGEAPVPPFWPALELQNPGSPEGERAGRRLAEQELLLRAEDGREWTCRLSVADWQRLALGQQLRLQVDRFGVADCASFLAR
ncbi:hypothetical protein [Inhella proteolytica]|uniref:Uncharacterized protein n=1 Tax=Inhella proteolytica TaxID=2795029 RepID=A0A931J2D4_9BURK|nr:hypothetical protein [Inhella proteolytica]MBH9577478.1 hypothetical protein [Inhella proteolytica]